MSWLIIATGFLASVVLSVLVIHPGASLAVALLGEEKCLDTASVNGCNWWPMSVLVSTALVLLAAGRLGWSSLYLVPVGPLLTVMVLSLTLRFGREGARQKEFDIRAGKLVDLRTGAALQPTYVESNTAYCATGPASGYSLYTLVVHDGQGGRWSNGYVSKNENERMLATLTRQFACLALSLGVECRESPTKFQWVVFGAEWTHLLCGDLSELTPQDRAWWRQWLQPAFGVLRSREVTREEVGRALDRLEAAYREQCHSVERIQSDIQAIRSLLANTQEPIRMTTQETHSRATEQARGDGWVGCQVTPGGVLVETIEHRAHHADVGGAYP